MKIIDNIKKSGTELILSGLFAILVFLAGSIYHDLSPTFLQTILESTPKPLLLKLLIAAMIVIVLLSVLSLYFYLKNRNKLIVKFGILWDKNKEAHCPSCEKPLSHYYFNKTVANPYYEFVCIHCNKKIYLMHDSEPISLPEAQKLLKS